MPSAETNLTNFDDVEIGSTPGPAPVEEDTERLWFAEPPKRKKKKAKKYAPPPVDPDEVEGGGENVPFTREITPPEPLYPTLPETSGTENGETGKEARRTEEEGRKQEEEPTSARLLGPWDDKAGLGVPIPEAAIEAAPKPPPAPPSVVRSPRPAPAQPAPSSLTPPSRPSSLYGPPQYHSSLGGYRPNSSNIGPAQSRRESFPAARTSPRPRFVEPAAPPHMAQPHFYGLPDIGLGFGSTKESTGGKAAGSDGYCCSFDSFADCGDAASSKKAKDALLVGSEGGLEVFRVLPTKVEVVGRLEGLRGSVIGAKILPHVDRFDDLQFLRPLVAVIVHGPMCDEQLGPNTPATHYQTMVEVYSLQTQEHVSTLYKSHPVPVEQPTIGHPSTPPGQVGDLSIAAYGKFVIVSSGKSGEVYVFSNAATFSQSDSSFRCLGKFWTSLQTSVENTRPVSAGESSQGGEDAKEKPGVPLMSLSQRWLAIVPPPTSAHISIQGWPLLSEGNSNPPGLASHVAPPQPPISCEVAGVDSEDFLSQLTRQAAQGFLKYGQKGLDMGWQGWKELTNPTPPSSGSSHGRSSSKDDQFPPTKAPPDDPRRDAKEPAIISIIDLEGLLQAEDTKPKYPPAPLASFALVSGCNFLSFSSTALRLLTASRKGEISTIWDLTQIGHGSTSRISADDSESIQGPQIKQILRIPRSSPSVVVDAAWSRDDNFLALLTAHGTIHLHEVPSRPPSRKRRRRSTVTAAPAPEKAQPTVGVSQGLSPPSSNRFIGAFKSSWQQVSTQVNTIRSQNPVTSFGLPTTFAGIKEATASAGSAGGKALAKGLSQGLSAAKGGASDYWHAEDNKIRHKALQDQVNSGSLKWIRRQGDTFLIVVCGGTVHLHPVQRVERRKSDIVVTGLKHDKYGQKHFALPSIRTSTDTTGAASAPKKADECTGEGPHGFWSLRISPTMANKQQTHITQAARGPPPQANEVETNPPYCPFHVDSRVDIFAFGKPFTEDEGNNAPPSDPIESEFHLHGHGLTLDGENDQWIFGEPLPSSTKMNTHDYHDDIDNLDRAGSDYSDDLADQVESRLTVRTADDSGGEQIQINTRRLPAGGGRGVGRYGVGEDDVDFDALENDFDSERGM